MKTAATGLRRMPELAKLAALLPIDPALVPLASRELDNRDFGGYLSKFSSEKRLTGFMAIHKFLTDAEYWPLLSGVWQSVETIHHDKRHWKRFLTSKRACRELIMTEAARAQLARMPNELKIYRGFTHKGGQAGFSWTLKRKTAEFFTAYGNDSRRAMYGFQGGGLRKVVCGKCRKRDVIAFINGRKENEIVIDPENVIVQWIKDARDIP